ncbi:MAG TPA: hypothetical protein VNH64_06520 [Parvularculaceae bacterium]|nr:hypothetical protein [Parvularculaceae bacterium]
MKKFLKKNDGLVTIEWVGIAAVMLVAAIVVAGIVMGNTKVAGETLGGKVQTMTENATPTDPSCVQSNTCGTAP